MKLTIHENNSGSKTSEASSTRMAKGFVPRIASKRVSNLMGGTTLNHR